MKKLLILVIVLTLSSVSTPVFAKGKNGPAGNSNKAHLYLYEKDPSWNIVKDGAWGKMTYDQSGEEFSFVFNGHGLVVDGKYTLIYYPDPWPGEGLICLGNGVADQYGDVHIKNSKITGDLPAYTYENYIEYGAKIWLILSDDVDCEEAKMIGWNQDEYLFENNLITFDSNCDVYRLDITSVNNNPGYVHWFEISYPELTGKGGRGTSSDETVSDIEFDTESMRMSFKSVYPNPYTWYPSFTLGEEGILTFHDGYGTDNVNSAEGIWECVDTPIFME